MKRTLAALLIITFSLLVVLPVAMPLGIASAQSGYTIDKVDHQVKIMYSGHIAIIDTFHISGTVTDGFMIGLPYKYSAALLKGIAYDDTHVYQLNLGVQMGQSSGSAFYGATVDFNGNTPSVFTVAFILSNQLITEQGTTEGVLDFPAYPSLAQPAGSIDASILFPATPTSITIAKDDGTVTGDSYSKTSLPAYTYSLGKATFQIPAGTVKLATISSLDRQINIDPTGTVTTVDNYNIVNNSTSLMSSFVLALPLQATNIIVKDQYGTAVANVVTSTSTNALLVNATLATFLASGQSQGLVAQYNLPGATIQGSNYVLSDFQLFPAFTYYVNQATITFNPPEGATIVTPKASSLDSSSTLTRQTFQDSLAITKNGLSFVDTLAPQQNTIQLAYSYNPIWVSFRPTFWAAVLGVIACIVVVFVRRRKPKEETYAEKTERLHAEETAAAPGQAKVSGIKMGTAVSTETIKEFINAYEDRKQLKAELKAMDIKAQKGKIPRRQYKVQRSAIEARLDGINRSIANTKQKLKGATGGYSDLVRQLDLAEEDLNEAEENIKDLDMKQSTGEISIENYKKDVGDYQKQRDKAESAINGILLRLREKIR